MLSRTAGFAAALLLWALPAGAAIAFDAASSSATTAAAVTSWTHTATGTNLILIVGTDVGGNGGPAVSSVTFNAVALTKLRADFANNARSEFWYLIAPPAGTFTITVTLAAAPAGARFGAISLTGVDQAAPIDAQAGGTGTTAPTTSITTVADNAWVVDALSWRNAGAAAISASAPQVARVNALEGAFGSSVGISTKGPQTPPGATTMSWTSVNSDNWGQSVASIKPAGGAAPSVNFIALLGAGCK